MQNNISERVQKVIAEKLGWEIQEVKPQSNIMDDLGADSLDVLELIMELENEFAINIPDDAVENLLTVQQAIDLVTDRAGGK